MNIEIGKTYKQRNGVVVEITPENRAWWKDDGRNAQCACKICSMLDLVADEVTVMVGPTGMGELDTLRAENETLKLKIAVLTQELSEERWAQERLRKTAESENRTLTEKCAELEAECKRLHALWHGAEERARVAFDRLKSFLVARHREVIAGIILSVEELEALSLK